MASYKLIQDVEADDKLLGPLSFRQFVFALFTVFLLYISYLLYTHHAEVLDAVTIPLALAGGFFSYPFGKDQPTEVWAIAKLSFLLKPRRRIWAQSGVKELVTITVPKKIEIQRTDGLSQTEVKSRLQALANTIDSRGWAIKNVYQNPLQDVDSERLISASTTPQDVPEYDVSPYDDLFDEESNPIAQQFKSLLQTRSVKDRQNIMNNLNNISRGAPLPEIRGPIISAHIDSALPEEQIARELKDAHQTTRISLNNMHALRQKAAEDRARTLATPKKSEPEPLDPAIINASRNNDKNVDVLSREVDRALGKNDESRVVEISLH